MAVTLLPSQIGGSDETPPPVTADPVRLCVYDVGLFIKNFRSIPGVFLPWSSGDGDEMSPKSFSNLICLALQFLLLVLESFYILSLPLFVVFPLGSFILYLIATLLLVRGISWIMNGTTSSVTSNVNIGNDARHVDECWIFLNGVATGHVWLQSNVDRLALTFRRPIIGVLNRTYGILFDLIQCIIERDFSYSTDDIRRSYATIKENLLDARYKKVILILHSQGGIEGAIILDWLLAEVSQDILQRLEIYTFGNASNHFNNPHRSYSSMHTAEQRRGSNPGDKAVRHIEHYANSGDFVACWGVLSFRNMRNRYMGQILTRNGSGHLLNQHYLGAMFPLGPDSRVLEENAFMNAEVEIVGAGSPEAREGPESTVRAGSDEAVAVVENVNSPISPIKIVSPESKFKPDRVLQPARVKDFSRLWLYRNGRSPPD
ncbi:uncharacterized protein BDZ99DRAFT_573365 [Mytilinidion resinicola]|uniref:DUF676 domain-containing protein n=1 Tax=Mytilinidion resinicola TaxID=574789 RepID=A0A6A6YD34_9PEZI|nr:uncharacterized protein BDZ99DRAFT_573365 [Mytilinidion resinicola]KAF2806620.1 hypothetical protein BDZ99DRAFT_573365 [Mytilinidion resinicola]